MARSGFVYIWRDKKHKMYYIGSHWGLLDDGYVCSSKRMKNAYRLRPNDFTRRILFFANIIEKKELHIQEQYWLNMIKISELNKKYYNAKTYAAGGVNKHCNITKKKMSIASKGKSKSAAHCISLSIAHKGQIPWNKDKEGVYSVEARNKISKNNARQGKPAWNRGIPQTLESKQKQKQTWELKRGQK